MNRIYTDTSKLDNIIKAIPSNRRELIKKIAFQVEALAKMKAPVDTGALRNSIYTAFSNDNKPPAEATETLPTPQNELIAFVGPSVEYAISQELGTSTMKAQPFLLPALRQVEADLENHAKVLVNE